MHEPPVYTDRYKCYKNYSLWFIWSMKVIFISDDSILLHFIRQNKLHNTAAYISNTNPFRKQLVIESQHQTHTHTNVLAWPSALSWIHLAWFLRSFMRFRIQISVEINKGNDSHPSLSKPVALNLNKTGLCYEWLACLSADYLENKSAVIYSV